MDLLQPPVPTASDEAAAARGARDRYVKSMAAGHATLADLFLAVDGEGHLRILSHMHVSVALEAIPGIDKSRSAQILSRLMIADDEHLDFLGGGQRKALINAVYTDDASGEVPGSAARARVSAKIARA
jgi:hypothetical protein